MDLPSFSILFENGTTTVSLNYSVLVHRYNSRENVWKSLVDQSGSVFVQFSPGTYSTIPEVRLYKYSTMATPNLRDLLEQALMKNMPKEDDESGKIIFSV